MTREDAALNLWHMINQRHVEQKDVSEFTRRIYTLLEWRPTTSDTLRAHRCFMVMLLEACEVDRIPHPGRIEQNNAGHVALFWVHEDRALTLWIDPAGVVHGLPEGTEFADEGDEPMTAIGHVRFDGAIDEELIGDVRNLFELVFGESNVYASEEEILDLCEIREDRPGLGYSDAA